VNQEAALWEWQHPGQRANRQLIRKSLENKVPEVTYSGDVTAVASSLPVGLNLPDAKVIEALVKWSLEQSEVVKAAMFQFLVQPEDRLEETIAFLMSAEIITKVAPVVAEKTGFIDALVKLFESRRVIARADLMVWARTIHQAKRPEATLRQALRRLLSQGKIEKVDNDSYNWKG